MIHTFSVDAAQKIGLNQAIVLQLLASWCDMAMANGDEQNGLFWAHVKSWEKACPYLGKSAVKSTIKKLCDSGFVTVGADPTWYAVTKDGYAVLDGLPVAGNEDGQLSIVGLDAPKIRPFKPPTLDEVRAYCEARHSTVDPESFFEYFEATGWTDAKGNRVRSWKGKVITWENKGRKRSNRDASDDEWDRTHGW